MDSDITGFLIDLDGTIYSGSLPVPRPFLPVQARLGLGLLIDPHPVTRHLGLTMAYTEPDGLISGAKDFLGWLINTNKPFVLLSNTGAKGSVGVQQKLARLQATPRPIKLKHCFTAAEAQIEYASLPSS